LSVGGAPLIPAAGGPSSLAPRTSALKPWLLTVEDRHCPRHGGVPCLCHWSQAIRPVPVSTRSAIAAFGDGAGRPTRSLRRPRIAVFPRESRASVLPPPARLEALHRQPAMYAPGRGIMRPNPSRGTPAEHEASPPPRSAGCGRPGSRAGHATPRCLARRWTRAARRTRQRFAPGVRSGRRRDSARAA